MRWDDEAETASTCSVCSAIHSTAVSLEKTPEFQQPLVFEEIRQSLNNAGNYLLSKEKVEDGGSILKYSLKLSDDRGIVLNENVGFLEFLSRFQSTYR